MSELLNDTYPWLRPSALPKLAACPGYRPQEGATEAAARGTRIDNAFRELLTHGIIPETFEALTPDERECALWAAAQVNALAGTIPIVAEENRCSVRALGMLGTVDAFTAQWSADLKSGQMYDYTAQQAFYALALMDKFFADEWTVFELYCDLRQVKSYRFTRDQAEHIVRNVIASALDETPRLRANDYCTWCAARYTCETRKESLAIINAQTFDIDSATPDQLRNFILAANVAEDFSKRARDVLKNAILAGQSAKGVALVSKRGVKLIKAEHLRIAISRFSPTFIADWFIDDEISLSVWERAVAEYKSQNPGESGSLPDLPPEAIIETPGVSYLRVSYPKNNKKTETEKE